MQLHHKTRIMITSGGGPGVWGLLHALRQIPNRELVLLVQDPDSEATLGAALADVRAQLPLATDPSYVEQLLAFCRKQKVQLLIPVVDAELCALATRRAEFEALGTKMLLPPLKVVETCASKWRTYEKLSRTRILPEHMLVRTVPQTREAVESLGYPARRLCIRPVALSGGRGVHILDANVDRFAERMLNKPGHFRCTVEEFLEIRAAGPADFPLVVSEFLPGDDLGIDVLARDGNVIEMVIRRKRGQMFNGNPMRMEFRELDGEREWVNRVVAALELDGLVNIDARYAADGTLKLLEINPRPSACIGMSCGVVNLLAWAVDLLLSDRTIDRSLYYRAVPAIKALRVLADVILGAGAVAAVTDINPRRSAAVSEAPARKHFESRFA